MAEAPAKRRKQAEPQRDSCWPASSAALHQSILPAKDCSQITSSRAGTLPRLYTRQESSEGRHGIISWERYLCGRVSKSPLRVVYIKKERGGRETSNVNKQARSLAGL